MHIAFRYLDRVFMSNVDPEPYISWLCASKWLPVKPSCTWHASHVFFEQFHYTPRIGFLCILDDVFHINFALLKATLYIFRDSAMESNKFPSFVDPNSYCSTTRLTCSFIARNPNTLQLQKKTA